MKRVFNTGILTAIILFSFMELAHAQRVEKSIRETFDHSSSTLIEIDSKFGEVEILHRAGDNIEVIANLWVESSREEDAKNLLSMLDAQIEKVENKIIVRSILPEKMGNRRDTKFRIDFKIYTPENIDLVLSSKYGSAFIEQITGNVNASIAYGNLTARNLSRGNEKPLNSLNLAYSTGNIESAGWLKVDLSYSKLTLDQATAVMIISKYSSLSVDKTSSLVMESRYDTYSIGEIKNFLGNLKYGNLKIDEVKKKFEIESQYTSVKIGAIAPEFEQVKINNLRGSYKVGIDDRASFTMKGEAIRGDISVAGMKNINSRTENANKYIDGTYGNDPVSNVNIYVKEGSVKVELN